MVSKQGVRALIPGTTGIRLDLYLAGAGLGLTRSQAQRLIDDGLVGVSGSSRKANYRLRAGDVVEVEIPEPEPVKALPEDIPIDVIYEDPDIIVVDKPAGMVVHPAAGNFTGTLVNALLYRYGGLSHVGGEYRPGIVHRLDKDTSGVMVVARNDEAHHQLARAFKAHENVREYVAITIGAVKEDEGTVAVSIGRHVTDRKKMSPVTFKGRSATTHFSVLERFTGAALVKLRLATGRTHQVRVHMAHIGHPLAGDKVYGGASAGRLLGMKVQRQMLHARLLGIKHPRTGEYMEFTSELPDDMLRVLEFLRRKK
jgi:23S rRNA pseudouridine1911/1915/1917 synthase